MAKPGKSDGFEANSFNSTSYLSKKGIYVYRHFCESEKRWVEEFYDPSQPGNSNEWTILLKEMDHEAELQDRYILEHTDWDAINEQKRKEKDGSEDGDVIDGIADSSPSIHDQAFPENNESQREKETRAFIKKLPKDQRNLVFDHLGADIPLSEIRNREIARTGVAVTQQAFSNRFKKIKDKALKELGHLFDEC